MLLTEELLESFTVFGNQNPSPEVYSALFQSGLLVATYEASRNLNAVTTLATLSCNSESYVHIIHL